MEYKGVWTIAEAYEGDLKAVSFELLSRGRKLADELNEELVSVLIGGKVKEERVNELIKRGADRVIIVEDQLLDRFIVETYSNVLIDLIKSKKPEIVLSAATVNGRTLMPHVAMKIHAGLTADCTELGIEEKTGNLLQTRPAIGGNILATIKSPDSRPQMATVRPKSSRPLEIDETRTGVIERVAFQKNLFDSRVKHLETIIGGEDDVNIQESDIVVSGGKGMKKSDNFKMLYDLAHMLGGVVGASRDAVDRGWAKYPQQVGLSGKTVTPNVYFAFGISGAIQHLAGMKTAETIISVNTDEDATIFQVSDFGIVGDLFEVLPLLNEKLAKEVK
ncbi:MAG: electron transfer flavoprotein subunit alpha/FixB family protein [Tissierellales bacterium]|jgi:electron transfer flavoprotein alpha subunit|nr:electron transfer flavoprotein subunit alpha/FixB family protein [Tissierellales bacterium]MBN2827820.1 electron transfer flavoprotein subunit alpha/FixB family protein [Tissierellales bacterium]